MKDTIEMAFIDGRESITTDDLLQAVKDTKSISNTLKDKIKEIKSTIEKIDIKPASKDEKAENGSSNDSPKASSGGSSTVDNNESISSLIEKIRLFHSI